MCRCCHAAIQAATFLLAPGLCRGTGAINFTLNWLWPRHVFRAPGILSQPRRRGARLRGQRPDARHRPCSRRPGGDVRPDGEGSGARAGTGVASRSLCHPSGRKEYQHAFRVALDCRRPDPPHPSLGLLHRASMRCLAEEGDRGAITIFGVESPNGGDRPGSVGIDVTDSLRDGQLPFLAPAPCNQSHAPPVSIPLTVGIDGPGRHAAPVSISYPS